MPENINIDIDVSVGNNNEFNSSSIANANINIYTEKTILELLDDSYEEVINDINEITDASVRRQFLGVLDNIRCFFKSNMVVLESIIEQINCKNKKTQENNKITIVKLLSFFVISFHVDSGAILPSSTSSEISIKGKKNWLFNAAQLSEISLEKHISKIAEYLYRTPNSNILNGNCFITMLTHDRHLNCSCCTNGVIQDISINILSDIINTNSQWQQDFFDLKDNQNITFRCGKCASNVTQYECAKGILEEI